MEDEATKTLIALAQHSEGVRATDKRLKQWTAKMIDGRLKRLVKAGTLRKVALGPRNVRYFADERDARLAEQRVAHMSMLPNSVGKPAAISTRPSGWESMPAGMTERTKFTRCPSPPDRFTSTPLPMAFVGALQRGRVRCG
jgi:hypothetical protein